jgi:hypothetical protein
MLAEVRKNFLTQRIQRLAQLEMQWGFHRNMGTFDHSTHFNLLKTGGLSVFPCKFRTWEHL